MRQHGRYDVGVVYLAASYRDFTTQRDQRLGDHRAVFEYLEVVVNMTGLGPVLVHIPSPETQALRPSPRTMDWPHLVEADIPNSFWTPGRSGQGSLGLHVHIDRLAPGDTPGKGLIAAIAVPLMLSVYRHALSTSSARVGEVYSRSL